MELFKSGYNCSQSVVAAFAYMYGFTQEQALRMSASFGGGIGPVSYTHLDVYKRQLNESSIGENRFPIPSA